MKNILAENLLRFGVKNLSESDKRRLSEVNPQGSTLSPEAQAQIDKMITASNTLVDPIKALTFTGTGKYAGNNWKVYTVTITKNKDTSDVSVNLYFTKDNISSFFIGVSSSDKKTPVISNKPIGSTGGGNEKTITGPNALTIAAMDIAWVSTLTYDKNKTQWDTVATALTNVTNKYIQTGLATKE